MIHELLKSKKLVLASGSPRRRELFSLLGLKPIIEVADIAEPLNEDAPSIQAMHHASNKATVVEKRYNQEHIIVAADTLVAVDTRILGKPSGLEEAKSFLRLLSANSHSVYTGVCITYRGKRICDYECTEVSFASLNEEEIEAYTHTQEPFDKAGAYGIQGYGAQFITGVHGCYFNVMGFPVRKFYEMLIKLFGDCDEVIP